MYRLNYTLLRKTLLAIVTLFAVINSTVSSEPLTLTVEQAVERGLHNNPSLRQIYYTWQERKATSWQTKTTALPRLDLQGAYSKTDPNFFPDQAPFITGEQYSATAIATHTLISGGLILGRIKTQSSLQRAARHDYRAAELNTAHLVRAAFYDVLLAEELVKVAEGAVEMNTEEARRAKIQFEIGDAARVNVLRAEVELANSIPEALRAKHNLRLSKANLANLIGYDLDPADIEGESLILEGTLESDNFIEFPGLERLILAALENRHELRSALSAFDATKGEVRSAWSGFLPRVDLTGSYTWSTSENTFRAFDSTGNIATEIPITIDLKGWRIGATASMPLFDFLGNYHGMRAARARSRRAEIMAEDTRRLIEYEMRQAYSAYLESVENIRSQEKNVESALESFRLARESQQVGQSTQLDVQQARLGLTTAQVNFARANRNLLVSTSAALTAAGLSGSEEGARYGIVVVKRK
ncbi:MAG: TolC family protein [candidate division Zixibacteria bacterium]|nr:TolC family protein [candidate division Zixibacteria bacterium]